MSRPFLSTLRTISANSGRASWTTRRSSTRSKTWHKRTRGLSTKYITWRTSMRIICYPRCSPSRTSTSPGSPIIELRNSYRRSLVSPRVCSSLRRKIVPLSHHMLCPLQPRIVAQMRRLWPLQPRLARRRTNNATYHLT